MSPSTTVRAITRTGSIASRAANCRSVTSKSAIVRATVCHLSNLAVYLGKELQWDPKTEKFDDAEANESLDKPARDFDAAAKSAAS